MVLLYVKVAAILTQAMFPYIAMENLPKQAFQCTPTTDLVYIFDASGKGLLLFYNQCTCLVLLVGDINIHSWALMGFQDGVCKCSLE